MLDSAKKIWFYAISAFFIIINACLLYTEHFEFLAIPALVYIGYLALFKLDKLYLIVIFLVPLSVNLDELSPGLKIGMALPTEPLIVGMMLVFFIKLFFDGSFNREIVRHPVTLIVIGHILWIAFTTITSELPVVSFKFLLSRIWYVVVFYFIASQFVFEGKNISKIFWLYIIGFIPVLFYTFYQHSIRGFDQASANWVMNPFFNDHTSYGACLVMLFPFLIWKLNSKEFRGVKWLLMLSLVALFFAAVILSYTRAAWVSLVGALGVFIILKFRIRLWVVMSGVFVVAIVLFLSWNDLFNSLEKNKQDSSSNLTEHVESISNVSSDASNLERLNRWKSAFGMFSDRPIVGFGPGTYAFEYAPYQKSRDKTIISTNAGDGGNAHSEFLGPLSEQGVLGMLFMFAIIISTCVTAVKIYKRKVESNLKMFAFVSFLGLVTYYLHGILNNFLDTDKASSLFWGFTAIIVVVDIITRKQLKEEETA